MLQTGEKIPDFSLKTFEGDEVTPQSIAGRRALLCFFPFAFSGVCTEQFSVYQQNIGDATAGTKNPNLGPLRTAPYFAVQFGPGDIKRYPEWPAPDERVHVDELRTAARTCAHAALALCG